MAGIVRAHRTSRPERSTDLGDRCEGKSVVGDSHNRRDHHERDGESSSLRQAKHEHGQCGRDRYGSHRPEPVADAI